jgi:hypothetical protein
LYVSDVPWSLAAEVEVRRKSAASRPLAFTKPGEPIWSFVLDVCAGDPGSELQRLYADS